MIRLGNIGLIFALVALLLQACGNKKTLVETKPVPEWVNNRPINPSYYIGVGSANKQMAPLDFADVAKKNALNDLASEIRVTVRSESFLNTMQVNRQVQEAYNSTIATSTDEAIEGYEVVDVYETPNDYFIFYRLSRAQHAQIRAEKKRKVMQAAYDQLRLARESRDRGDVRSAADQYLHGLFEMAEYWSDVNQFTDGTESIYLDNTIYRELQQMVNELVIESQDERIELSAANRFRQEVVIRASYKGNPVGGLKLSYEFDNGSYRNTRQVETDRNGEARITVSGVNVRNKGNNLEVRIPNAQFRPSDLNRRLAEPMVESLRTLPLILPIQAQMPVVHVSSSEYNQGKALNTERLSLPLRRKLDEHGFSFTLDPKKADLLLSIEGDTREGGTSQGFFVSYLEMRVELKDQGGNILYKNADSNIKGLQLNFEAAGMEAYKNGAQRVERNIADELIEAIF